MLEAFRVLEEEKHINKEDIIDAVVESLKSAYKRRYGQSESAVVEFNEKTGDFQVYTVREVVDEVFDSRLADCAATRPNSSTDSSKRILSPSS